MTPDEIKKRTEEKVTQVKKLCAELSLSLYGKQRLTPDGYIENVAYFLDTENYPLDGKKPNA